jgi:sialic acid synthase SpsE
MNEINISGRRIGLDYDPLVIAEIGINHGGDIKEAFKLVDAAYTAGAEVVKHQTHVVDDEMSGAAKEVIPGNTENSIYEIIAECALNEDNEVRLKEYVESKGMIFISTPFSRAAADRLERMGVSAYKIGSGECNNYPLLKYVASFGKPIILSTGMNTIKSVAKAVRIFEDFKIQYALLHTTNLYPTPPELVRLGAMSELKVKFPNAIIGLSDHTTDNLACFGAVALGASILERHFTDSMSRNGPDIVCSMDVDACKQLIDGSKILKLERGGKKEVTKEEQVTMDFAFATVVSISPIKKGEIFTKENLWIKRPGTGAIPAEDYESILGKSASKDVAFDTHLDILDINY